ncbi:MAG: hypothetical protein WEC82_01510, partial [Xanthobacteraceae bacterium]
NVWDQWPPWAELCFNVLFFVVLVALAYGASTGSGALYDGSVAVSLIGIAVFVVFIAMSAYDSLSGNERRRLDEIRERHNAERVALIQAMGQPEYWGNASTTASDSERPILLASLRAEGFQPGQVMTLANFLARKAVEKELRSHGISPSHIEGARVTAAAQALFAVRADKLIAEAKARLSR